MGRRRGACNAEMRARGKEYARGKRLQLTGKKRRTIEFEGNANSNR
jgi:hypothetical protein